mgnify:CR=1 FL=1|tara:strand:- start:881 stop:1072 length:192 start_codon:yes stop_codon:yes gene_type:complete
MSYTNKNQELDKVTEDLIASLKEYRRIAENKIMDTSRWNITHRLRLKYIVDRMFELQIKLKEL